MNKEQLRRAVQEALLKPPAHLTHLPAPEPRADLLFSLSVCFLCIGLFCGAIGWLLHMLTWGVQ